MVNDSDIRASNIQLTDKNNVLYIHIPAYHHSFPPQELINRLFASPMGNDIIKHKPTFFYNMMKLLKEDSGRKTESTKKAHTHNGQMLLRYINNFIS